MAINLNDIQTRFRIIADQGIKALQGIVTGTERATKGLDNLEKQSDSAGKAIAKGLGALGIGALFRSAIQGAEAEAEALRQLEGTVNATGQSFEANRAGIDQFITGLTRATKFSDDELIPALNRAVIATNDIDKAMRATELGTKLAAAGFGSLESNAVLVARVLEGQVSAIGRVIPEFRDLEERLEGGASEADLAAEALQRLQNIANNLQPPSSIQKFSGDLGELKDALGEAVRLGLGPFLQALTPLIRGFTELIATGPGQFAVQIGVLVLGLNGLASALDLVGIKLGPAGLAGLLTGGGLLLTGLVAVAAAVAILSERLDELSREADAALDKTFKTERLEQFRNEVLTLQGTLRQLELGSINAAEAEREFNRVGVEGEEGARKRIAQLETIIPRLEKEKKALDNLKKADEDRAKSNAEKERVTKVIAELEKEKAKRIELEILKEEIQAKDLARGKELAQQVPLPDLQDTETVRTPSRIGGVRERNPIEDELAGVASLASLAADAEKITLGDLTDPESAETIRLTGDAILGNAAAVNELALAEAELEKKLAAATEEQARATEQAQLFDDAITGIAAGAVGSVADGLAGGFIDLASGIENAGQRADQFFKNLIKNIGFAIARALVLQTIISAIGGGGFGRILGGLFQDPFADMLARFEGSRFADLFFQGVTRELTNTRDRLDLALADNRDVVEKRGQPISVIVNEATPETTAEFTDRLVEPRVRARSRQRSTRGDLTGAEIDRALGTT